MEGDTPATFGLLLQVDVETPGMVHGLLFDGGSVLSLVMEEVLVSILNAAAERGLTTDSSEWPLAGLERWPDAQGDVLAGTVSADNALKLRGLVYLRVTLRDVSGTTQLYIFKLFILRKGSGRWPGLLLGAPVLDAPPLGLGHRATLCGHVLTALNMTLPRLEDSIIRDGLRGATIAAIAYGSKEEDDKSIQAWAGRLGLMDPMC